MTTPSGHADHPHVVNHDMTTTQAESTNGLIDAPGNNSDSRTIDEDDDMDTQPGPSPKHPASTPLLTNSKAERSSPRGPAARRQGARISNTTTSDVFGATQTQTQASSDDSDREAELARRVRAAGTIGSAAVRTPAGGLGTRMVRKRF